ncbi:receptor-type tyrosine-protein phosphatase kappa-like [Ruditapes philippinarum]|uniref:receptor-type tyrosine-protein phosphatase kappa-like n=1 Tax=Ruditapes philippinarum TaxID=129788 RepID=UPI00295A5EFE|nr:receptor-type tyrosine-protein phosphatase kappa-like [Ruditapes philippinarum]
MLLKETSGFLLVLFVDMVFSKCSVGCQSCSRSICTSCEPAYFLSNGFCSPCPENCQSCNSWDYCTSCKQNMYGLHARCTFNCDGKCLNNECQDDTGYCTQCRPGFYGLQCQHNCSLCENKRCDLRTCSSNCGAGYYNSYLGVEIICQTCPSNCKHCTDGKTCYICNDGYHLYAFNGNVHCVSCQQESQCSDYCVIQGCYQCQIHNNALVCANCPEGHIFNGSTCENNTIPCSNQCSNSCDSAGVCIGECYNGWSGEKCSENCDSKCLKCSKGNRNNCLLCKDNFYSTDCSLACNPSCIVKSGYQTCEHASGYCLNGCKETFWGDNCGKPCPDGCKDLKCDRNNGTCTDGCKDGLSGDKCTQTTTIEITTSQTRASSHQTLTEGTQMAVQEKKESNELIIGASAGGGVLILILIIVVVFVLKRRKKSPREESDQHEVVVAEDHNVYSKPTKNSAAVEEIQDYIYAQPNKPRKPKKQSTREISKPKTMYDNFAIDLDDKTTVSDGAYATITIDRDPENKTEEETDVDEIELEELDEGNSKLIKIEVNPPSVDLYYNTASLVRSRIQISDLLEYVRKKTDYEDEFEKLPKGLTRPCDEALTRTNRKKNRYNGVYAYDATRVVLQSKTYINANYIDGHKKYPEYIASLGPTKDTMNGYKDFWEMIWEEKTDKIIMLTNLDESGKMKCEQYWPDQGKTKNYHGYKVVCIAEKIFSEFTSREFSVNVQGSGSRKVTQYHYTAWPDRSVPDNVASLIEFRNKVEQTKSNDAGPIVVHCSAGICRTGTYIALDTLIQEGMNDICVDIFGRVMALRGQRGHMVQNLEQYIFLHRCLLYALTCDPDPLPVTHIPRIMTDDKISHQFQTFTDVVMPKDFDRKSSANKKVRKENRHGSDIPGDDYRVRLSSTKHDYINAVYVNGYENPNKFIASQTPMPNTVEDFISMLFQEKCACVINLDDENLKDKSIGHYLPQDGKVFKVGHFQVTCKTVDTTDYGTIRDMTISRTGLHLSGGELHLKHYQYNGWNQSENVPSMVEPFLELAKDVEDEIKGQRVDRPIVVHCLTGAERSCLFCAVSVISEKCFFENEISVLNTICQLRSRRKSAFTDIVSNKLTTLIKGIVN